MTGSWRLQGYHSPAKISTNVMDLTKVVRNGFRPSTVLQVNKANITDMYRVSLVPYLNFGGHPPYQGLLISTPMDYTGTLRKIVRRRNEVGNKPWGDSRKRVYPRVS